MKMHYNINYEYLQNPLYIRALSVLFFYSIKYSHVDFNVLFNYIF